MTFCNPSQGSHISSHEQKRDDLLEDPSLSPTYKTAYTAGGPRSYYQGSSSPLYDKNLPDFSGVNPSIYAATVSHATTEPSTRNQDGTHLFDHPLGTLFGGERRLLVPDGVCQPLAQLRLHPSTPPSLISDLDRATCRQQMNTTHPGCKIPTTTFSFRSTLSFFAYQFTAALLTNNVSHPFPIDRYAGRESSTVPS